MHRRISAGRGATEPQGWKVSPGAPSVPPPSRVTRGERSTSIPPSLTARAAEQGILAAAMKIFARRGFSATRVEDILEEAGIARRTFYRYYTSKEDVLAAVYDLATTELLRALDAATAAVCEPVARLRATVHLYLDFHLENASLLRVVMGFASRPDSALAARRRAFRCRMLQALVRAADARRVGPLDGFLYVALLSALEGVALELMDGEPTADEASRAKRTLVALLESGLQEGGLATPGKDTSCISPGATPTLRPPRAR